MEEQVNAQERPAWDRIKVMSTLWRHPLVQLSENNSGQPALRPFILETASWVGFKPPPPPPPPRVEEKRGHQLHDPPIDVEPDKEQIEEEQPPIALNEEQQQFATRWEEEVLLTDKHLGIVEQIMDELNRNREHNFEQDSTFNENVTSNRAKNELDYLMKFEPPLAPLKRCLCPSLAI